MIVSFSGVLSGQIIINIPEELVKIIYHRYMKGILAIEIDRNVKESIFEIWKLVIGNTFASFYGNGVSTEVSSYFIIEGNDINYTSIDKNITIIEYETSLAELSIITILDIGGKEDLSSINN